MKSYAIAMLLALSMSQILCADTIYTCQIDNTTNKMSFSTSSITGQAIFSFNNISYGNFILKGKELNIEQIYNKTILVSGSLATHEHISAFFIGFPLIKSEHEIINNLELVLMTHNENFEVRLKFQCEAQNVRS